MREWRHGAKGFRVREILTAKPGQRPGRWVNWHEMRKWLVGWHGYCIFKFELLDKVLPQVDPKPWRQGPRAEAPSSAPAPAAAPATSTPTDALIS
jgi:hypothetical protein